MNSTFHKKDCLKNIECESRFWVGAKGTPLFFVCEHPLIVWLLVEKMKREILLKRDILHTYTHTHKHTIL